MAGPLDGLTVVDFTATLTGAQITQTLADFGCEVVLVEPPGGVGLRRQPAWPFWGRGKRSIVLDLKDTADRDHAQSLAAAADVVVETWRPGVADRLGLGYDGLSAANPALVYASVTGFGRDTPWSHLKGYEQVVLAKLGGLDAFSVLSDRRGPSFVASPYCSFSAAQLGLHGILAAIIERQTSGAGQRVETTLAQGILAHDPWNWLIRQIVKRYDQAFTAAPAADHDALVPNTPLFFRLMVGLSADGRWMQFSQTTERLWEAYLRLTGLTAVRDAETSEDPKARVAFWERALEAVRQRTYDEWLKAFDEEPNVWAELFRHGTELLHHPQLVHDNVPVVIDDVLQPGPLVRMRATPAVLGAGAPALDEHRDDLDLDPNLRAKGALSGHLSAGSAAPPLAGITVIELGTFYAAPFGTTILAELGARVIKVEQLEGDPIRHLMPFPEVAGVKVLQGKESVAVDMASDAGREIVHALVRQADAVLQSFRAGVADRHGYTEADLLAVNPDLIYLSAPGYGSDGPCGHRPAFAPTIGAGSGLAYRNVGGVDNVPQRADLTVEEVKRYSMRMAAATMTLGQADGFSALGVATSLLLGLLAKRRGAPGQGLAVSMLSTMSHCLAEDMVEYDDRPPLPTPDRDLYGPGPLYRLYPASEGWVFLAAVDEWDELAAALELDASVRDDDAKLAAALADVFMARPAAEWEAVLVPAGVTCVEVARGPVEEVVMFGGGMGTAMDIVTDAAHPVIGDYPRLKPLVRFSRSGGVVAPAPLCGAHTDAVLTEFGYDETAIASLRADGVIL